MILWAKAWTIRLVPSIKESFELAIKRRSKIENAEVKIIAKKEV